MNITNWFTGQLIKSLDLPALAVRVNEYSLNVIFKINIRVINLNISKRYKRHGTLFESTVGKCYHYLVRNMHFNYLLFRKSSETNSHNICSCFASYFYFDIFWYVCTHAIGVILLSLLLNMNIFHTLL